MKSVGISVIIFAVLLLLSTVNIMGSDLEIRN